MQGVDKAGSGDDRGACWSSWKTGMSINSRKRCSMMKHSGALMSSRLMRPAGAEKFHAIDEFVRVFGGHFQIDRVDVAKRLNSTALPSITGFAARAPRLPRPRMACHW